MDESNEPLRVVPELYFLIAKFLSGGPLKETAKTLLKELESVEVLPRRLDWEGNVHAQSYDEIASQYQDVEWDRLASVCDRALHLARSASSLALPPVVSEPSTSVTASPVTSAAATAANATSPPVTSSVQECERLTARLSLLSETLVRTRKKYSLFKKDHSLVRRIVSRELGVGHAALAGGAGGRAMFPPRLLSGLQLQRRTLGHLSAVYCLVFDCTGRYVVTGADDLLVKVWNASDGRLLTTLRGAGAEITDVCASADGALLACGSVERLVRVWCLVTGAPKAVLHAHAGTITAVHWAPPAHDVRWLASTSTDGSVAFWTCADGQFLSQPVQYVERLRPGACHMICAAWSAGGAFLAAGSADHHVRLYAVRRDPAGPQRVLETAVHGDAVDSIAWAHRGLRFVSGSKDGTAALWTLHATQWRHTLLLPQAQPQRQDGKRLKVTMVCWDCSDQFVITAVSDNTIRVWCARSCAQVNCLRGHRDEAYVLEAHPFLPSVLLSAGHDGQLFVWDAAHGEVIAKFHNNIEGQGDGAIFDAKWGGGCSVAASDSHGHLLLLGLGKGHRLLRQLPTELFLHTDYRPLVRDALGGALDEQTETPPHLMPPPFLVDVEGAPHPPQLQRLVPGRELLTLSQLIPAVTAHRALDRMIQELAGEHEGALAAPGGVWRGEGVRHTAGSWQRGDPLLVPHSTRPVVPPLPASHVRAIEAASAEMNALEQAWYRREMRRRPLMISTAAAHAAARGPRRRAGRPRAAPQPQPANVARAPQRDSPPEPESLSSDTSDSSVRLSGSARDSLSTRDSRDRDDSATPSDSSSSSTSSQYSDWEAGAALAPPARARRRPLPAKRRYSPSTRLRPERQADASPAAAAATTPAPELPEAYRVGEWLTAVAPRKAPYHPQMGDECLYFRLGHQRYFEAVAEKDLYKVNPRDKPWERTQVYECEVVKVIGIKYVIKPPRVVCLRLSTALDAPRARTFTVRYHDMPDVIDFLVLRQQYEAAAARRWGQGDRFRCMIDDSWWTGVVLERSGAGAEGGAAAGGAAASFSAAAAPHFLSLRVRWDNGEVERLSPWDLEPIDVERLPAEPGGSVPVLPHELEAALYRAEPCEWPPRGDRPAACRAIAHHVGQVMSLSVAEPFVAPVDLQLYPAYARVVPYPIDLATIRARFDNLFYRRAAAAQFDVRYLARNAEQFNEPHSPIVRQARLVTDLLLHTISHWRDVDVLSKYRELAAAYHSSDDEPLATALANKSRSPRSPRGSRSRRGWASHCAAVLRDLLRSPDAEPFKQPVAPETAPDYTLVVSHPMDLGTVGSRLAGGAYASREHFARDVRRVFANSRLYNTNKRSRIYSMTVRLSALFESLWARAPASPARRTRASRRTRHRTQRTETMNGHASELAVNHDAPSDSSSSSEPLAATSRRVHARDALDSSDSDKPLQAHRKGKGVGKKSKCSSNSADPGPSTSAEHHAPYTETNGLPSGSEGSALLEGSSDQSDSSGGYSHMLPADDLASDLARLDQSPAGRSSDHENSLGARRSRKRLRLGRHRAHEPGDARARHKRTHHHHKPKRRRERFTSGSSSSSSSAGSSASAAADARRYESDHSYRPRYSTDDDAPLHLYRQRQEGSRAGGAGPSRRAVNGHARGGVSLRARLSPGRYNEDSESDSVLAISKRAPLHHHNQRMARGALAHSDHNYFGGRAPATPPARPAHAPPGTSDGHETPNPVSVSSRGRVRKLTPKGQGLYGRKHHQ